MWATFPQLPDCLEVLKAWGFKYKTAAFTWAKTNPKSGTYFIGMGSYTRSNAEVCLFGLRGRLERKSGGVPSLVVAPRARHSEKPAAVREQIVQLFGDIPRIELFARNRAAGWDAWGNEIASDVRLDGGHFVRGADLSAGSGKAPSAGRGTGSDIAIG
jgi:N6-adenosine-specific RNA methylase IME4